MTELERPGVRTENNLHSLVNQQYQTWRRRDAVMLDNYAWGAARAVLGAEGCWGRRVDPIPDFQKRELGGLEL